MMAVPAQTRGGRDGNPPRSKASSATTGVSRPPGGRRAPPRRRAPPTWCWWSSTTWASPSSGCYGSDIATPVIDGLAAEGIRLTNFHTTALCSPTRACLLTGRNHHRNGLGRVADLAVGFPGYNGEIPRENGFLSEILRQQGYATYAVGKWHLTPDDETHMAAPRHSWPLGRGFDRWYGFHGGETHQFVPALYHDNHSVAPPTLHRGGLPPERRPGRPGHRAPRRPAGRRRRPPVLPLLLHRRLPLAPPRPERVDRALPGPIRPGVGRAGGSRPSPASWNWACSRRVPRWRPARRGCRPGTPCRTPSSGWPPGSWSASPPSSPTPTPSWAASSSSSTRTGDREDTLVILVSDNGASSEGGPTGSINDNRLQNFDPAGPAELARRIDELGGPERHNNYPWGWTMAGNTPFKRWKREVHEGGRGRPLHRELARRGWPPSGGRSDGSSPTPSTSCPRCWNWSASSCPTTIEYVPQTPIDGISFATLLGPGGGDAAPHRDTQYFEMFGSRALYHDGWKAVTFKPIGPLYDDGLNWNAPFAEDRWELYHVAVDPTELHDLADAEPEPAGRDGRPLVGGGPPQPGAPPRQPDPAHAWSTPSPIAGLPASPPPTTRTPPRCPRRWRPT